jgi:hypothetical protein
MKRGITTYILRIVVIMIVIMFLSVVFGRSFGSTKDTGFGMISWAQGFLNLGSSGEPRLTSSDTRVISGRVVSSATVSVPEGQRLICAGEEQRIDESEFENGYAEVTCTMEFEPEGDLPYGTVVYDVRTESIEDDGNTHLVKRFEFRFIETGLVGFDSEGLDVGLGPLSRPVKSVVGTGEDAEVYNDRSLMGVCESLLSICEYSSQSNPALVDVCVPGSNSFARYATGNAGRCGVDGLSYAECIDERYIPRLRDAVRSCDAGSDVWYSNAFSSYVWVPGSGSVGVTEPVILNDGEFSFYNPGDMVEQIQLPEAALLVDEYFTLQVPIAVPDGVTVTNPSITYSGAASGALDVTEMVELGRSDNIRTIGVTLQDGRSNFSEPGTYELSLSFSADGERYSRELQTIRVVEPSPYQLVMYPWDGGPLTARFDEVPSEEPSGELLEGSSVLVVVGILVDEDGPVPERVEFRFEGADSGRSVQGTVSSLSLQEGRYVGTVSVENIFDVKDVFVPSARIETESGDSFSHTGIIFQTGEAVFRCNPPVRYTCPSNPPFYCAKTNVGGPPYGGSYRPGVCLPGCFGSGVDVYEAEACCSGRVESSGSRPSRCI